jgi:hypothetical protein
MSVIKFPQPEDALLSDLLARSSEQLAQERPPEWVQLQLRAHLARHARAPKTVPAPLNVKVLQASVGNGAGGDFDDNGRIDLKAWSVALVILIAVIALMIGTSVIPLGGGSDASPLAGQTNDLMLADEEFVPVAAPQRWKQLVPGQDYAVREANRWDAAGARAWVVAGEVPSSQLSRFGLPFDPSRAGENVRAELLLHSSGEVLAVRLER